MIRRELTSARAYSRIVYLLLALPLGVAEFTFLVTAISFGFGTAVTLVGIPVLLGALLAWRWLAELERRLIGWLLGTHIDSPYRRPPPGASRWHEVRDRVGDPATWKDLAFLILQLPAGIVSFTAASIVLGWGLAMLTGPAWYWALGDTGIQLGLFEIDTLPEALAAVPLGALVLVLGIPGLSALGRLYGWYAFQLLGPNSDPELTAEVSELRGARARVIAAADAERRRLERDLHDGAQQRLVSLALTLRMAEKRAPEGGEEVAEMVRRAGTEAGLALTELRDLARGLHPAILTSRGLPAALNDLAGRSTVPVSVASAPEERLPDEVEAAAYFTVSECLANVAKHARATHATVRAELEGSELVVRVEDDGVGGADHCGSGVEGLRDRVGALDGTLEVQSPQGGGTAVTARIPLARPLDAPDALRPPTAHPTLALSDEEVAERMRRRAVLLRWRATALAGVGSLLVVLWFLTGAGTFWPAWPLLSLTLVAGLDAWFTLAARPGLPPRGRLIVAIGALAILNTWLVGVWLLAGAGYFWPVWPMLGSVVVGGGAALLTAAREERSSGAAAQPTS